jgi:hypothetical protein
MTHQNILVNYYVQNDCLNLTNNIPYNDLLILIDTIIKVDVQITNINIPLNGFKYLELIQKNFNCNITYYQN